MMRIQKTSGWAFRVMILGVALLLGAPAVQAQEGRREGNTDKNQSAVRGNDNPVRVTKYPFSLPPEGDYIIGPQDLLTINVWREPEISREVPVRPDGKISLPLVGEVEASGFTPAALSKKVEESLKAYLSNPEVTVIVQQVNSRNFNIVGEVLKPGAYRLTNSMTVLDAIAVAGGFQEFADTKDIYVLRVTDDGARVRIPFNYKDIIKGKKFYQNVQLRPGDTIVVP